MSKSVFTTNWYMYRVCLHTVLNEFEPSPLETSFKRRIKKAYSKKNGKAKNGKRQKP